LTIGCLANYGNYFKGKIDEVRIYNRALGAREIQDSAPPRFMGKFSSYISNLSTMESPEVYFSEAQDPPNPNGTAGSGLAGYGYRYSLNGSPFSQWTIATGPYFQVPTAKAGDELTIEVFAYDRLYNASDTFQSTQVVPAGEEVVSEFEDEDGFSAISVQLNIPNYDPPPIASESNRQLLLDVVPPEVEANFNKHFRQGFSCVTEGTDPEVRILEGETWEVSDLYVKCKPGSHLVSASGSGYLRSRPPKGGGVAPIRGEKHWSIGGGALQTRGPFRIKAKCNGHKVLDWFAQSHTKWYHLNPTTKLPSERTTGAESDIFEDACG
jgi:hypothetical protein